MKMVVEDQSMSVIRASALEQEKKHSREKVAAASKGTGEPALKRKRGGSGIIIAIIVFLLLGGATFGGFLWYRSIQQSPLAIANSIPSLLFAEQSLAFSISNSSPSVLKASLGIARTSNSGSLGSITRLIPTASTDTSIGGTNTTHTASAAEFFTAIGAQVPDELLSAIGPDIFIGIHATDGNQALIVVPVTSYEHAFAGMLAWEPTLGSSLSPLFEQAPASITGPDGVVSTNAFKDIVIKNYDVRIQSDAEGNPKILYSFPNRSLLIITSSQYTLTEALSRLQAARKL
jgi:hypothetical protein